jgi:hypothetical protein
MAEHTFVINATITLSVTVEARTLAEAVKLAQESGVMSLCHQCAEGEKGAWSTSGELDYGDPSDCVLVGYHGPGSEKAAVKKWRQGGFMVLADGGAP